MIISDTDFLSAFGKICKVDLIFEVFKTKEIIITRAVYDELKGVPVFENLLPYFSDKNKKIKIKSILVKDVPNIFGEGERESITLARDQKAKLLMDDRKAGRYAEDKCVDVIDIPAFLFYCKEKNILNVSEITNIIFQLKDKDFYEFEKEVEDELVSGVE